MALACSTARWVPATDVLLLFRKWGLNPEVRREVGEVGDDGDERPAGADVVPAFVNFAIEVGDDGDQQVGGVFAPEFFEEANQRLMEKCGWWPEARGAGPWRRGSSRSGG